MAAALTNAGFVTEAICPVRHPLAKTKTVHRIHTYRGLTPLTSFANAISTAKPDLIVPGDDLATLHLHNLYHQEYRREGRKNPLCDLIERSLGASTSFPIVTARAAFIECAQQEGIRVPETERIETRHELRKWIRGGSPLVLKADGTSGGVGVRIVHTIEEAERAFRVLQAPPLLARATKRALIDKDTTLIWPSVFRTRHVVNAQQFVAGREATSLLACWNGTVLASLHFQVLNKRDSTGPSTVLRLTDHPEMCKATETMARRLQLSGLHGFDFVLDADSKAYLIEINPRATQVGHLTLGAGRDLPASLYAAVTGKPVNDAPKLTEKETIALFPQEWLRNPASVFLHLGYHDVPWDEADWIKAAVRKRKKHTSSHPHVEWNHAFSKARRTP